MQEERTTAAAQTRQTQLKYSTVCIDVLGGILIKLFWIELPHRYSSAASRANASSLPSPASSSSSSSSYVRTGR